MAPKIAIVYYSMYGHIRKLVCAISSFNASTMLFNGH